MAVSVFRAHAAHFVVFGLPMLALVGAIGWQELRARWTPHTATAPAPEPGSVGLRTAAWGLVIAAFIHAFVVPAHFRASALYGAFFTVLAVVQVACAWRIAGTPGRALVRAIAISSACVVVLWLVSRTTGLPVGPTPWRPEGFGAADEISSALEALTVWGCWIALHPLAARRGIEGSRSVVAR
ncbi:MAG TPA: hypothetical protein VH914_07125 [Acidimicrobiia bacterium]|jgi:hypothetical protein|nr:hypothetical protein [Acidimicrobiia bacterium]